MSSRKLDIRPRASIFKIFSRLSYVAETAIAEFVDNSTQSYIDNEQELLSSGEGKLVINIEYGEELVKGANGKYFKNKYLQITDNAYGMEIEDFERAILLDSVPVNQQGRNEFGMGLKTAASWFGNKWSVTSTEFGSNRQYFGEVDIDWLDENEEDEILIKSVYVPTNNHGTKIRIDRLTKNLSNSVVNRTKNILASTYRRDLKKENISIFFNEEELTFANYSELEYKNHKWKDYLDIEFEFSNKLFNVTGFVGILAKGSFNKAGFALFRRNRVILGGEGQNYKPKSIFGQDQSQVSLKLYGELNLEDFPVNQAKDGFIWDDGLEDTFIETLKDHIHNFIDIAKMSKKERVSSEQTNKLVSEKVKKQVQETLNNKSNNRPNDFNDLEFKDFKNIQAKQNSVLEEEDEIRNYLISTGDTNIKKEIETQWVKFDSKFWIQTNNKNRIKVNINHPFFKPYVNDVEFKILIEKLAIAFVLAEDQAAAHSSKKGYIQEGHVFYYLNDWLENLSED